MENRQRANPFVSRIGGCASVSDPLSQYTSDECDEKMSKVDKKISNITKFNFSPKTDKICFRWLHS